MIGAGIAAPSMLAAEPEVLNFAAGTTSLSRVNVRMIDPSAVNIYLWGEFESFNPRYQRAVEETMRYASERFGST